MTIKPLSSLTTANGVANESNFLKATHILAVNKGTANVLITRRNGSTTVGTFTLPAGDMVTVVKEHSDTLFAGSADVEFTVIASHG